ncbi:PD-(D/E)XK nuclease superfamily 9 [Cinara cedri]|uniref:PD-(D/E)XK nuclease superfamily 9 n=1 Tax=Cinara cedri TaxID=506608 RepID=A0A5E4M7U1_9HEMI|nr:PD-(D/E)XK nuclease superfamily 9 [Cinara cedri]
MDYNLLPPGNLKEKALIEVAIALWTHNPIKDEVLRVFEYRSEHGFDKRWKKIEKIVQEIVKTLELPQTLKAELSGISTQIGLEILRWAQYYGQYYCESAFFNNIGWTPQGAIDAEKTARNLLSDESLSVLKRYKIACTYCFEDIIHDLWKQLGKEERHLKKMKKSRLYEGLVLFWSYHLYGKSAEVIGGNSINEYGLNIAVDQGNSVAVKYFWKKLNPEEKERNLEKYIVAAARESYEYISESRRFSNSCYTGIVCFLLNQVDDEQRKDIFSNTYTAENILNGLLNFPYRQLFIHAVEYSWDSLQEENYHNLLYYIGKKVSNHFQSYKELLRCFWQKIPDKEKAINTWEASELLSKLFKVEDYVSIGLILGSVSIPAREKFILNEGPSICYNLVAGNKWQALSNFMNCCLLNKDAAIKFKAKERISWYSADEALQENAPTFYKFVDDFIASFDAKSSIQAKGGHKKRKEDIDLESFFNTPEVFEEEFDQVLSEVPNIAVNEEFWFYFFLGSILPLPETYLKEKLNVKKIQIEFLKTTTFGKILILRTTKESGEIICTSIGADGNPYPIKDDSSIGLKVEVNRVLEQSIPLILDKNQAIEKYLESVFVGLTKVYDYYKTGEQLQLSETQEVLRQAFIYGFFKMNTEYNCFIEFNAGLGTADLVLQINDISIIAECKIGNKTAKDAIQQIKNKCYYHLSILGKFKVAFLVGVNFTQEKGLMIEKYDISKQKGIINVLMDDESEEIIQGELKFLCYTKNIGISNPDNPSNHNEADPKNKYVGSFTALILGQMLQYCGQNDECELEYIITQLEEGSKARNTELVISDSDNKLKLHIIEFTDKGGNESPKLPTIDEDISSPEPEDGSCGDYNIKVCINKNDEEFLYKIIFVDGQVTVEEEKECSNSVTKTRSGRELKSTKDPYYVYSSSLSQEAKVSPKKSPLERKKVNIERLISDMDGGKQNHLREIIISYRDFIYSEANLQLFLKGLFMNAEINEGEHILAEVEKVSRSQLESYTDKGNLKYIFEKSSQLYTLAIVFCKENAMCNIEVKITENDQCNKTIEVNQDFSIDSGFASSEDFSNVNILLDLSTCTLLTPNTSLLSLNSDSIISFKEVFM